MIYIGVILLTVVITFIAEKNAIRDENNKVIRYRILYIVGLILLLSLFAAIRNEKVGVDINTYLKPPFDNAFKYDFFSLIKIYSIEPLFGLIIYTVAHLFGNIHVCMFIVQLIMLSFFFKFATYFSKKSKTPLYIYVLVYLIFCYFESFCIIRQHISLAILLCSLAFLDQKRYKATIMCFLTALLFHYSSLAFVVVYILYYVRMMKKHESTDNNDEDKSKKNSIKHILLKLLIVLVYIILFTNIHNILMFFINCNILPERYIYYVNSKVFAGNGLVTMLDNGIMKWLIASAVIFLGFLRKKDNNFRLFQDLILLILFIQSFISIITPMGRLNIFYLYIAFISLANSYFKTDTNSKKDFICKSTFVIVLLVYFVFIIILDKCGYMVFPYYV